jgi:hypothetical protein
MGELTVEKYKIGNMLEKQNKNVIMVGSVEEEIMFMEIFLIFIHLHCISALL